MRKRNETQVTAGSRLAEVVLRRRLALGMTRAELRLSMPKAGGGFISQQYIYDIERGARIPTPETLRGIAVGLRLDPDYLEALAGRAPRGLLDYIQEFPETAPAISALFRRARLNAFTDWEQTPLHASTSTR